MMALSKQDIARLLANPSPQVRADVAAKIGHQLASQEFTETELVLSQDIVRHLARDLAVNVRAALAESVKKSAKLPHDVALKLAQDVEEVSLPVLEFSSILSDEDLMEIVSLPPSSRAEAIARRETISEKLSEAIVENGGESAVVVLLSNQKANISAHTFEKVVSRYGDKEHVQASLVHREKLPLAVAERLVTRVSEALREHLATHHELPREIMANIIMQSREQATINLLGSNTQGQDLQQMVRQMKEKNRLTPSLIIRALCVGDVRFFEACMAVLADIPVANARVLVHDKGRLSLKALYDKTGLPPGIYPIIRVALEVVEETQMDGEEHDRERYRARVIARILTQYEDFNPDDLKYLLDKLSDLIDKAA